MDVFEAFNLETSPLCSLPQLTGQEAEGWRSGDNLCPWSLSPPVLLLTKASLLPPRNLLCGLSLFQNLPLQPRKSSEQLNVPSDCSGSQMWICSFLPLHTPPTLVLSGGPQKLLGSLGTQLWSPPQACPQYSLTTDLLDHRVPVWALRWQWQCPCDVPTGLRQL